MEESSSYVLGLKWDHENDTLVVSRGTKCDSSKAVAHKLVLSLVSKLFDPIGLVAPFTVTARLLLNDVWRLHGRSSDDVNMREMVENFSSCNSELSKLGLMTMPGVLFPFHLSTWSYMFSVRVHRKCSAQLHFCALS